VIYDECCETMDLCIVSFIHVLNIMRTSEYCDVLWFDQLSRWWFCISKGYCVYM